MVEIIPFLIKLISELAAKIIFFNSFKEIYLFGVENQHFWVINSGKFFLFELKTKINVLKYFEPRIKSEMIYFFEVKDNVFGIEGLRVN